MFQCDPELLSRNRDSL